MQTTGVALSQFLKNKTVLQPSLGIASLACEHGKVNKAAVLMMTYKMHFAGLAKSMCVLSLRCFSFPSWLVNVWLLPLGLWDVYSHKKGGVISVIPLIRDARTLKSPSHSYLCFYQHLWQQQPRSWEEMERGKWSWKPQVFSYPLWCHFCSNLILAHRSTALTLSYTQGGISVPEGFLETSACCCYLGKEADPHLSTTSFPRFSNSASVLDTLRKLTISQPL